MINRGSTPTHKFTFPLNFTDMEKITITYRQLDQVIKKTLPDVKFEEGCLICKLSQQETMSLLDNDGFDVEIQVKCKDKSGNIKVSNILKVDVGRLLDEELM